PRARAVVRHPGVIVTFDSKFGPLSYWTDRYTDWEANLRAIALALQALRAVDRYGVAKRGLQYRGYKRLHAGGAAKANEFTTPEDAARFIGDIAVPPLDARTILTNSSFFDIAYRLAAKKLHPDNQETGDNERFIRLQ